MDDQTPAPPAGEPAGPDAYEEAARLYEMAAAELERASAHCHRAAEHFRGRDVPGRPRTPGPRWVTFGRRS
jgi:hypothetical protein